MHKIHQTGWCQGIQRHFSAKIQCLMVKVRSCTAGEVAVSIPTFLKGETGTMGDEQFKVPEKRSYSPTAVISFSSCADILSVNQDTEAEVQALIHNRHLGSIETKRLWKCLWRQGSWSLVPVTWILSTWTLTSLHSLVCISYSAM